MFLNRPPQKKGVSPNVSSGNGQIKLVQDAFFYRSISFCPSCDKCPQCYRRSAFGGKTAKVLASLGPEGFESKGGLDPEGGIQPSFQDQASSHQDTSDKELICQSPQEQLPAGGIAFPSSETSCGKGTKLSGILHQTLPCPKTK